MSDPDKTEPPVRQPNTLRTWLPRIWRACTGAIAGHPEIALIVWLVALAVAIVL